MHIRIYVHPRTCSFWYTCLTQLSSHPMHCESVQATTRVCSWSRKIQEQSRGAQTWRLYYTCFVQYNYHRFRHDALLGWFHWVHASFVLAWRLPILHCKFYFHLSPHLFHCTKRCRTMRQKDQWCSCSWGAENCWNKLRFVCLFHNGAQAFSLRMLNPKT